MRYTEIRSFLKGHHEDVKRSKNCMRARHRRPLPWRSLCNPNTAREQVAFGVRRGRRGVLQRHGARAKQGANPDGQLAVATSRDSYHRGHMEPRPRATIGDLQRQTAEWDTQDPQPSHDRGLISHYGVATGPKHSNNSIDKISPTGHVRIQCQLYLYKRFRIKGAI